MASKKFKLTDANGSESSKVLKDGATLGDYVKSNQQGMINGEVSANSTTLRAGDHVEIIAKSGKAGC